MCGIIGYVGKRSALPVLLAGLGRLEYRGYDSSGVAVGEGKGIRIVRAAGNLLRLKEKLAAEGPPEGTWGIGHTRWATHGEPSVSNAHPQRSGDGLVAIVHNGIIENAGALRKELSAAGYVFASDTDTESAALLLHSLYRALGDPIASFVAFGRRVEGSFAIAAMFSDRPHEVYGIRRDSPLIAGERDTECFLASDIPALLPYTRRVCYPEENGIVRLDRDGLHFFDRDGCACECPSVSVSWDAEEAQKDGYRHFMRKEMEEQPRVVRDTFLSCSEEACPLTEEEICSLDQILITACGSAYHAGLSAREILEQLVHIPVRVEIASEFRYRMPLCSSRALVIVISQSGETADSLAALRLAKERGFKTLALVNVRGSTMAREAERVVYTRAGPEIAVATTKAYSAQLMAMYVLALHFARVRGCLQGDDLPLTQAARELSFGISRCLQGEEQMQRIAQQIYQLHDIFLVGRGLDHTVCMEGALKLKEVGYLHAEAYAAGELKHGTLSLIERGTPVIGVVTQPRLACKTAGNLAEVKSRGARVVVITTQEEAVFAAADEIVRLPRVHPLFAASLAVIPLQLLAYHVGVLKGLDVDRPRNLAKSVTVE